MGKKKQIMKQKLRVREALQRLTSWLQERNVQGFVFKSLLNRLPDEWVPLNEVQKHRTRTVHISQTTWPLIWIPRSTDNCPTENTTANDYRSLLQSVAFIEILVLYMLSKLWYSWEKKSLLTIKANRCYHWASFLTLLDCVRKL